MNEKTRMKIAIVDDDELMHKTVSLMLGDDFYVVGFTGIAEFIDDNYDAVICDLRLAPKTTWGVSTILALRPLTEAPLIVLTGMDLNQVAKSELDGLSEAGADEVLSKDVLRSATFPNKIFAAVKRGRVHVPVSRPDGTKQAAS